MEKGGSTDNKAREKIMYCAMPTRLQHLAEKIEKIAWESGYAPSIPFNVGPFKYFEGGIIGRPETLRFMIDYMDICGTVGVFGISEGVMGELKAALDKGKKIRVFPGLDPEWDKKYEELEPRYGDLFSRLRGKNQLIALVGARAIGKTFWSDFLLKSFGKSLGRVKNTTTRTPRSPEDHESYRFISEAEFNTEIRSCQFLEWDKYQGNHYGSSLNEIRRVLNKTHGIFAITPNGAAALNSHRLEVNLTTILLAPESEKVLLQNFGHRGITDPEKRAELLEDAKNFTLPTEVRHRKVVITGDTEKDAKNILEIVEPLIS
ncbi:MAG: hypothetical protein Q8L24_02160 [bacterium]|nr:hypothetical protein [bacterium]